MPSKSITDAFVRTVKLPAKDGGRRQSKSSSKDPDHACERALDTGIVFNEDVEGDGPVVFAHGLSVGTGGIVSVGTLAPLN